MSVKFGLSEESTKKIRGVFARFPEIEQAIIYGSRAKGTFKQGSDIDLTLSGDSLTTDIRSSIALELDDLLLPYEIDLSLFADLHNDELAGNIARVGRVFYKKP
jgi:uncharacterized protein